MEGKGEQLTAAGHRVGGACAERRFPHHRAAAPQQYRPADTVTAMTSCKQSCIQLSKITLFTGLFPSARATPLSAFTLHYGLCREHFATIEYLSLFPIVCVSNFKYYLIKTERFCCNILTLTSSTLLLVLQLLCGV